MFWFELDSVTMVGNEIVNSVFWFSFGSQDSANLALLLPSVPICAKNRASLSQIILNFVFKRFIVFFLRNKFVFPTTQPLPTVQLSEKKLSYISPHSTFLGTCFGLLLNFFSCLLILL